jgi:hypothetical protein
MKISEAQFKKLCDDVYRDRHQIYGFNPSMSKRDALFWLILGSVYSLLSIPVLYQPGGIDPNSDDPYGDAICELLQGRMKEPFDARAYLEGLAKRI